MPNSFNAAKLAILQVYPLNTLEVELSRFNQHPYPANFPKKSKRGILRGLIADPQCPAAIVDMYGAGSPGNHTFRYAIEECIPVLGAFEDLLTALPDGRIPAVEVAKAVFRKDNFGTPIGFDWANPRPEWEQLYPDNRSLKITFDRTDDPSLDEELVISEQWHIEYSYGAPGYVAVDVLRNMGFAVGLKPEDYIGKTK